MHHPKPAGLWRGLQLLHMAKAALQSPWCSNSHSLWSQQLGLSNQGEQDVRPAGADSCNSPLDNPTPGATRILDLCSATLPHGRATTGGLKTVPSCRAQSRDQDPLPAHRPRWGR